MRMVPSFLKKSSVTSGAPSSDEEKMLKDCLKVMAENEVRMESVYKDWGRGVGVRDRVIQM